MLNEPANCKGDVELIFHVVTGSQAYGTAVEGSDTDSIGVAIEPVGRAIGLTDRFEQSITNNGTGDQTIYSLQKFCRLALSGNPTILETLWITDILHIDARGSRLKELRASFLSKRAIGAFLGYMQQQLLRLKGERGQKDVNRKALVDQYGYDTKYAAHIIRLGYEGMRLAMTGELQLPLPEDERRVVLGVRQGHVSLSEMLTTAAYIEQELKDSYVSTVLPDKPDQTKIEQTMLEMYMHHWDTQWQDRWRWNGGT